MGYLVATVCFIIAFLIIGAVHIYTMEKIDDVQKTLLIGSKEWKDLDKCATACIYTFLMLFLFSLAIGVILNKVVVFEMLKYSGM